MMITLFILSGARVMITAKKRRVNSDSIKKQALGGRTYIVRLFLIVKL